MSRQSAPSSAAQRVVSATLLALAIAVMALVSPTPALADGVAIGAPACSFTAHPSTLP
ncbi:MULTISPECIES: hypothetical protein [unclassified Bordetella]|uniref:hypothetical protein n=1 Tax=unclassified Bordetella TaxID=2630031 RepID=UPI00132AD6AC|nr:MULTISPECIES: hypothetical protein [unclassified Bordetella]MVW71533.1 hypothetical protein [Bordetella sp. 15P40C-2]MVW78381.1 hypothetical protein [Bordetella sp. 02P26C-1]